VCAGGEQHVRFAATQRQGGPGAAALQWSRGAGTHGQERDLGM